MDSARADLDEVFYFISFRIFYVGFPEGGPPVRRPDAVLLECKDLLSFGNDLEQRVGHLRVHIVGENQQVGGASFLTEEEKADKKTEALEQKRKRSILLHIAKTCLARMRIVSIICMLVDIAFDQGHQPPTTRTFHP